MNYGWLSLIVLFGVYLNCKGFFFKSFSRSTIQSHLKATKFQIDNNSNALLKKSLLKTVAITGASGLIGTALSEVFQSNGIQVIKISTKKSGNGYLQWDPSRGYIENIDSLNDVDAVIHLAGENVASGDGPLAFLGTWTEQKKSKILRSRVLGTQLIADTILKLKRKPKVFISASAVGYYGYKDSETIYDEQSKVEGEGFLAGVCRAWEAETSKVEKAGIRTVALRIAPVLAKEGGLLKKLLPVFLLGAGGNLGSGNQGFSWITLNDAIRAIVFTLTTTSIKGPVNLTAPQPVDNAEFTKALGRALYRPTIVPAPSFAISTVFGEMGNEMLLGGQKVIPKKLLNAGFQFQDPTIATALTAVLKS